MGVVPLAATVNVPTLKTPKLVLAALVNAGEAADAVPERTPNVATVVTRPTRPSCSRSRQSGPPWPSMCGSLSEDQRQLREDHHEAPFTLGVETVGGVRSTPTLEVEDVPTLDKESVATATM